MVIDWQRRHVGSSLGIRHDLLLSDRSQLTNRSRTKCLTPSIATHPSTITLLPLESSYLYSIAYHFFIKRSIFFWNSSKSESVTHVDSLSSDIRFLNAS